MRNDYRDLKHLLGNIEAFIEQYYNRSRLHSALGYRPPEEFEREADPGVNSAGAPFFGAAKRTLDGEDRCETITGGRKEPSSNSAYPLQSPNSLKLKQGNPAKAIEILEASRRYELGSPSNISMSLSLYPVYVRGLCYLSAKQGETASAEFQKILSNRGIVQTEPIGSLAQLGLARAYVVQGDNAKAKAAYRDFLASWKDADADIPVLKEAKAENAKLQ